MSNDKPKLKLVGADGNSFVILGLAKRAALKAGWDAARVEAFMKDATSGDYDNLLRVCMENFYVV